MSNHRWKFFRAGGVDQVALESYKYLVNIDQLDQKLLFALSCPVPISDYPNVTLAHGGGGKLMHDLIQRMMLPAFRNDALDAQHDGAVFSVVSAKLAFTTDSYVVRPIVFPGGTIGELAVNGTVNDLAVSGARPIALSLSLHR